MLRTGPIPTAVPSWKYIWYRSEDRSFGAWITMEAVDMPDCGREALVWLSIMKAIGRRWARAVVVSTPSRSA